MSNDKTTLADVQPGGRVRLGSGLLPCPFCGAPAERIDFGIGSGENEGGSCIACTVCQHSGPIEFGYKENFVSNWNRRALAAQPSPGGQGERTALIEEAIGYLNLIAVQPPLVDQARRALVRALAVRQPVELIAQKVGDYRVTVADDAITVSHGRGIVFAYSAGDSAPIIDARHPAGEPVGEPVAYQIREHIKPGESEWFAPTVSRRGAWKSLPKEHYAEYVAVMGGYGPMGVIGQPLGPVALELNPYGPTMEVRALYAAPPAQTVDVAPRPIDTAPTDGTLVRLLVDFNSNATEDTAGPAWTIGSNNDSNVMADERVGWQFAGWCWTHDHFTEGEGTPVGWLPLVGEAAQAVDLGQFRPMVEEFRRNWANYGRTMTAAGKDTSTARQNVDAADRLLALIDSQAVGK
ncbi:hypothetical protein I5U56_06570 [Stenotrophomonas maltophilia]|nr:hypothetical protein [Stenotrophomonas maltophilia]MBH1600352.1 hypothetical protein [Stenotrophomonas maltophilia]